MNSRTRSSVAGTVKTLMIAVLAMAFMGLAAQLAQAAPAPLDGGQLSNKLGLIINGQADRGARINELADPGSITGADNIAGLYNVFGSAFTWSVVDPVVQGESLNANLAVEYQGSYKYYPLTWVAVGDQWKLTPGTICSLAAEFQSSC